jgi:hypothetical protein
MARFFFSAHRQNLDRLPLDDCSARRSPALQHLLNEVDASSSVQFFSELLYSTLCSRGTSSARIIEVARRLRPAHFCDGLFPVQPEIAQ